MWKDECDQGDCQFHWSSARGHQYIPHQDRGPVAQHFHKGTKAPVGLSVSQCIFVFEEIDCGSWKHIVKRRTVSEEPLFSKTSGEVEMAMKLICNMNKNRDDDNTLPGVQEDITLGSILEILDGIIETSGRMIIMTSNHPEELDPALLRPGRVDFQIEFKRMLRRDIAKMYRLWFDKDIPTDVYEKIKDYTLSQAELGNIFCSRDLDKIHGALARAPA